MIRATFISLVLRGLAMAGKFLLVFVLARYLSPEALGEYGLFLASIGLAIYFLGFDFYTFTSRELPGKPDSEWAARLRDQAVLFLGSYLVVFPLLSILFLTGLLNAAHWHWFYAVLAAEHLSQELFRLLVARGRPVDATFAYLIRGGLWPVALAAIMAIWPQTRNLPTVYAFWTAGAVLGAMYSAFGFRKLPWRESLSVPIDWIWLKKGIRAASIMLIATIAFRAILAMDRYFLKSLQGETAVGVYTLFISMAMLIHVVVDTGASLTFIPRLVEAYRSGEERFEEERRRFSKGVIVLTIASSAILLLIAKPALVLVGKPLYLDELNALFVLTAGFVVFSLGMIPHYELYVRRQDTALIMSAAFAAAGAGVLHWLLVPRYSVIGSAAATSGALVLLTGLKVLWPRAEVRG